MSTQLFNILAEGQQPRTLGTLSERLSFSRPIMHDGEPVHFAKLPIKLGGTEMILPEYLKQFEEFATRALTDYINKSAGNDYLRTKATMYLSQRRLDAGQFSLATGVHMDIDLEKAIRGDLSNGEIYVASDASAITTRVYTNPFDIDPASLNTLNLGTLQDNFEQELTRQAVRNGSFDPQAYELVNFSDTQPHVGRCLTDQSVDRTFVFIIFTQDSIINHRLDHVRNLEETNEDLFDWMVEQHMRRSLMRHMEL